MGLKIVIISGIIIRLFHTKVIIVYIMVHLVVSFVNSK